MTTTDLVACAVLPYPGCPNYIPERPSKKIIPGRNNVSRARKRLEVNDQSSSTDSIFGFLKIFIHNRLNLFLDAIHPLLGG